MELLHGRSLFALHGVVLIEVDTLLWLEARIERREIKR
jgi:hypothetical protein